MSPLLKIILAIAGAVLLLGIGFYLWLVVAYEPPAPPGGRGFMKVEKKGNLDGMEYEIRWKATDRNAPRTYEVATGLAADGNGTTLFLRSRGAPVPIDVKRKDKRVVEVVFDGVLPDGNRSLLFEMANDLRYPERFLLENGKRVTGNW